ncbi:MAG: DUF4406 domain-containing protein [Blastocatellia bacterium]|nr:DUF4406 domain-containing protein [Blastocatellia bacterium]
MLIAVAGPYSAPTAEVREKNLLAMNQAAAAVFERGHIPLIGVNAALPVVACLPEETDRYEAIMAISLAVVGGCDALLLIGESPGANRERDLIRAKGLPVFTAIEQIPPVQ